MVRKHLFFPLRVVEGVHARFEHEVSTNVFLTPAAGDPRQRSTKQKLELKNVAGLNFGAFFVLSAKHIRVCYPCTKHIRVCIVFSHLLLANTRASVIYRPNTYAFAYFNISTKHNPHTFHTHSAHIRVCSPKRSKHIRVWFVVEKNTSRLLLFSSISNQTHTRLLSF